MAGRADISPKTLSRLENGHWVGSDTLLAVAQALGILDRLLDGIDSQAVDPAASDFRECLPQTGASPWSMNSRSISTAMIGLRRQHAARQALGLR